MKPNIVDWSLADRGGHFAAYDALEFISSKIFELKNYITKNKFLNS